MDFENESFGWPGDGSGEDDFADYNANEADDYAGEGFEDEEALNNEADSFGGEDSHLDAYYEGLTDLGD